jgi:hypothetical protein
MVGALYMGLLIWMALKCRSSKVFPIDRKVGVLCMHTTVWLLCFHVTLAVKIIDADPYLDPYLGPYSDDDIGGIGVIGGDGSYYGGSSGLTMAPAPRPIALPVARPTFVRSLN